jgi:hypothetical protein
MLVEDPFFSGEKNGYFPLKSQDPETSIQHLLHKSDVWWHKYYCYKKEKTHNERIKSVLTKIL